VICALIVLWSGHRSVGLTRVLRTRPNSRSADASDVKRWRETRWIVPKWLAPPPMTVGLFFLIAKPIGYADWVGCLGVIIAVLIGLVFRRRYDATVVESTERSTTVVYTKR
jgi:hypothetical protein